MGRTTSTQRPDPEAWRLALELAGRDVARLEVTDPHTVIVHNQRRP